MNISLDKSALEDAIIDLCRVCKDLPRVEWRPLIQQRLTTLQALDTLNSTNDVTILLADIRGFTSISEQVSASDVLLMLNHYFARMNDIILSYGGLIDKYMGDSVLVVFGIPFSSSNDAYNAVACAIQMQLAMDEINAFNTAQGYPELFVGIGLNSGTVSSGQLGSALHNEFSVIGDGVNLVSRIESHSLRGQVLISDTTFQQIEPSVTIGQVNRVLVKGKQEPVTLYEVLGLAWDDQHMAVPQREIRNSRRLALNEPFSCNVIAGKEVLAEVLHGRMVDLSYNGMFILLPEELPVLTNIRFSLALSLAGGSQRDIYGKIVSVRRMDEGFGYGVELTDLDEASSQSIRDYINRIIGGG